jgi:hypothetical protein
MVLFGIDVGRVHHGAAQNGRCGPEAKPAADLLAKMLAEQRRHAMIHN